MCQDSDPGMPLINGVRRRLPVREPPAMLYALVNVDHGVSGAGEGEEAEAETLAGADAGCERFSKTYGIGNLQDAVEERCTEYRVTSCCRLAAQPRFRTNGSGLHLE